MVIDMIVELLVRYTPKYSTTDHWIQESIKGIFNFGLFWAVGTAEKNPNCPKYATFEVSFILCFHGQKHTVWTVNDVLSQSIPSF